MYCIYKFYKHFLFIYIIFEKFCFINNPFIEATTSNLQNNKINQHLHNDTISSVTCTFQPPPSPFTSENKINVPCHIASVIS